MKIYLFDLDWVIVLSELFIIWLEKEYWISKEIFNDFFKYKFSDCLIWKTDLKEEFNFYFRNIKLPLTIEEIVKFWFDFENKIDYEIMKRIKELRQDWNICCIFSNQEKYRVEYIRKTMNLEREFDELFFSCEIWIKKPNLEFFEKVYLLLKKKSKNLKKENIYFYDDDVKNVEIWNKFWFNSFIYNKNLLYNL
jgi:FMN phosphatase YigB (HAD superfamily)